MKKTSFTFVCIGLVSAALSCTKNDEVRKGIDDLNGRLDELQVQAGQINEDLATCSGILNGTITITGYTVNEFGDYTVQFSDGGSMTIYSGALEEEVPVISVGEEGWTYTVGGETYPMPGPDGEQVPASGATPQVRVTDNGRWEYSYDGVTWIGGFGPALPTGGSIFDDVYPSESGDGLVFTWHSGDTTYEKEIKLYGGLDLSIDYGEDTVLPLSFAPGQTREFGVVQTNVSSIAIETTSWGVSISDDSISITAPQTAGSSVIVIKIFSEEGYARAVTIPVIAE